MNTWNLEQATTTYNLPFAELLFQAQTVHRQNFDPNAMQVSTLLSIKTGKCPEDCAYCPQSAHYNTGLQKEPLMQIEQVVAAAKQAKATGSTRFCMGAAWRSLRDADVPQVCAMVRAVKDQGLETCVTLGMLKPEHASALKDAGLDFYNHNIDTSPEYYDKIISTRTFQDRLDTLEHVRQANIKVCCGGILGMGETTEDRLKMLLTLANLSPQPESVPINQLIPIPGTPLAASAGIDSIAFIRTIATARIMLTKSFIRLSAGREQMSQEMQALCFFAGANSVFYGEKLLTAKNQDVCADDNLFKALGIVY